MNDDQIMIEKVWWSYQDIESDAKPVDIKELIMLLISMIDYICNFLVLSVGYHSEVSFSKVRILKNGK